MYLIYIHYTVFNKALGCHVERITDIYRRRTVTAAGAQRILRQSIPTATVTRIETFIYE